jgi:hypothetical protein
MEAWESRKIESIDNSRARFDGSSRRMDFGRFVDNVTIVSGMRCKAFRSNDAGLTYGRSQSVLESPETGRNPDRCNVPNKRH